MDKIKINLLKSKARKLEGTRAEREKREKESQHKVREELGEWKKKADKPRQNPDEDISRIEKLKDMEIPYSDSEKPKKEMVMPKKLEAASASTNEKLEKLLGAWARTNYDKLASLNEETRATVKKLILKRLQELDVEEKNGSSTTLIKSVRQNCERILLNLEEINERNGLADAIESAIKNGEANTEISEPQTESQQTAQERATPAVEEQEPTPIANAEDEKEKILKEKEVILKNLRIVAENKKIIEAGEAREREILKRLAKLDREIEAEAVKTPETETKPFSADFIDKSIRKLLSSLDAVKNINSLEITGEGNKIKLSMNITVSKFFITTNINLKDAYLTNQGNNIVLEEGYSLTATKAEGTVKDLFTKHINSIGAKLKEYIEKQENKKVSKIEIKDGQLEVTF